MLPDLSTYLTKSQDAAERHGLSRSLRGAAPGAIVDDVRLARDLNRVRVTEHFGYQSNIAAVAGTATEVATPGGFRLIGQGLAEAADSGMIPVTGEPRQRMSTTDEAAHTIALATPVMLQPNTQGPFRWSGLFELDNLDTKAVFMGFAGTLSAALDPRVTGDTVTLTLVDDDLVGVLFDASLTDADRWFVPHNKSNANATIATTAAGVDTGKNIVATSITRVDLGIDKLGNFFWQIADTAGVKRGMLPLAVDVDEELGAVLMVEAVGAAIENLDVYAVELDHYIDNS